MKTTLKKFLSNSLHLFFGFNTSTSNYLLSFSTVKNKCSLKSWTYLHPKTILCTKKSLSRLHLFTCNRLPMTGSKNGTTLANGRKLDYIQQHWVIVKLPKITKLISLLYHFIYYSIIQCFTGCHKVIAICVFCNNF